MPLARSSSPPWSAFDQPKLPTVRQHPRIPCVRSCASQQRTVDCSVLLPVCSPRLVRRHRRQTVQVRWPAAVGTYCSGLQALGHHVWSSSMQDNAMCVRGPVEFDYKGLYQHCEGGIYRLISSWSPSTGVLAQPGLYDTGGTAFERCSLCPRTRCALFMLQQGCARFVLHDSIRAVQATCSPCIMRM